MRADDPTLRRIERPRKVDPWLPFVKAQLRAFPKLSASRLYGMVRKRGYEGGPDHFRHVVATLRPKPPKEAYSRLRKHPGEEAQVDWFEVAKVEAGRGVRKLMAFMMVLSYSRSCFARFYYDARMHCFLHGHAAAFEPNPGLRPGGGAATLPHPACPNLRISIWRGLLSGSALQRLRRRMPIALHASMWDRATAGT